jgi:hypothetical protein
MIYLSVALVSFQFGECLCAHFQRLKLLRRKRSLVQEVASAGGGWREGGGGDEKRGDKSKKHLRKKFNRVVKHNALGVSLVIEAE